MKKPNLAEDLVPIGEFKTHASALLRQLHTTKRPLVITQNGRAAAVVLTPADFEELGYREFAKAKIRLGLASAAAGPAMSAAQLRKHLKAKIAGAEDES